MKKVLAGRTWGRENERERVANGDCEGIVASWFCSSLEGFSGFSRFC